MRRKPLISLGLLATTMLCGAAHAQVTPGSPATQVTPLATPPLQQTASQPGAPAANSVLNEVIVTAQRRSENIERTPLTVTALTATTLAKQDVSSEADLRVTIPGLQVQAGQNSEVLNFAIRGQSLDAFSNSRPGVLPYFDEVQVGGAGGSSAFYDLQSIQVLKGPQGTLFGRNSTGGAVLFTTAKPADTFGGYLSARFGDYSSRQIEGAVNIPLADDKVLLRISGVDQFRDGFQHNDYNGDTLGTIDRAGGRISLTVKPIAKLSNTIVVDYLHSGGSPQASVLYSLDPAGAIPTIALTNAKTMDATISALAGVPGLGNGSAATYFAQHPNLDKGGLASFINTQKAVGPYEVDVDGRDDYKANALIISNVTAYDLSSDLQVRNIIGYTHLDDTLFSDTDGSPYGIDNNNPTGKVDDSLQFSEELQLVGKAFDRHLTYTAGAYYSDESTYDLTTSSFFNFPIVSTAQFNTADLKNTTYALYSQGTYDLSDLTGIHGLSFTAGIRYTSEAIRIHTLPGDEAFTTSAASQATFRLDQSKVYDNISYTAALQDQLNSNLLVYITSRRSYRNGGYNNTLLPVPGLGTAGGDGYGTETDTDIETGAKFQGRIAQIPVLANVAVFSNFAENAQHAAIAVVNDAPAAITVNVPRARIAGFELDGQVNPVPWLNVGGSLNYTNARFTDDMVSIAGASPVAFDSYPDTPILSATSYVEVNFPITSRFFGSVRGDGYAQSGQYFSPEGGLIPGTRLPGYTLINFGATVTDSQSGISFAANLKNAFDRTYFVGGEDLGELFQLNTADPGDRRTYTFEVRYKF